MMEGWKETQIGSIPVEWEFDILSNYSEKPQYGFTDSATDVGNAKFLRITDITEIGVDWNTVPFCNCPETIIDNYKLLNNDIVFARIGATTGKSYLIKNPPRAVFASYLIRIRTKEGLFPDFLFYYFNSELYWKQINSQKGNNLKGGVNGSILGNLNIIIPPLAEQHKIAHVLSTVQKAIEQQDNLIRTTTELKKAIVQKLFTEGIRGEPQKETEIGLVPESWVVKPLIEAVEYIDYGVSQAIPKNPPDNGVKIVSTADINRKGELLYNKIRTIEVPKRTAEKLELKDGDLLFNWRNSAELIGKSTVYHSQPEPHIFASFILRICCGEERSHNYFLKHLMNFYREEGIFIKLSRRAVNQANYNRNEISVLKIPIPPYKEQVEIAQIIGKVENKIEYHNTKIQILTVLFKTLLHELMTGQRRVHELEFK
jgi:type I restriction enzyme S subunit